MEMISEEQKDGDNDDDDVDAANDDETAMR